jgi:hypothetical protein
MPKRTIDPANGQPQLTYREQMLVDEFIRNGGNGARAAAAAGYGATRPDQAAYKVLHRAEVQRHIRERIAESHVTADEIVGTLASFMRGNLCEFLDQSGDFSIDLAREKQIGHLLKAITITTREIAQSQNSPAEVVRTCRAQLQPPVQAARVLARIFGIDRGGWSPDTRLDPAPPPVDPETLDPETLDHNDPGSEEWPSTAEFSPLDHSPADDNLPDSTLQFVPDSTGLIPESSDQLALTLDFVMVPYRQHAAKAASPDSQPLTGVSGPSTPDPEPSTSATRDSEPQTQNLRLHSQHSKTHPLSPFPQQPVSLESRTLRPRNPLLPICALIQLPSPTEDSGPRAPDSKTHPLSPFWSAARPVQAAHPG